MSARASGFAERKRQVLARAELERLQIRLTGREARALLTPITRARHAAYARPAAVAALALAVPLLGAARVGRLLRIASVGVGILRLVRGARR